MRLLPILLLLVSFSAAAQAPAKLPRLCFLALDPDAATSPRFKPFFDGLRDVGLIDGSTITIDIRSTISDGSRFPALAAECVASRADVIVTTSVVFDSCGNLNSLYLSNTPLRSELEKASASCPDD